MQIMTLEPFTTLDTETKKRLSGATHSLFLKKGETPFTSTMLQEYFYVVQKGKIKTYQLNLENAKEQTIFILRAGDMFDTITLLDSQAHDVMYEVLEESEVIQMPMVLVRELITSNREFNQYFFPYLAKQMRHMEELATDISLYSTEERLIKLLLQNLDPSNILKYHLIQGLSNTEIASLIGTVRHVVERHLKKLKADGIIDGKSKKLQIDNAKKLLEKINLF